MSTVSQDALVIAVREIVLDFVNGFTESSFVNGCVDRYVDEHTRHNYDEIDHGAINEIVDEASEMENVREEMGDFVMDHPIMEDDYSMFWNEY